MRPRQQLTPFEVDRKARWLDRRGRLVAVPEHPAPRATPAQLVADRVDGDTGRPVLELGWLAHTAHVAEDADEDLVRDVSELRIGPHRAPDQTIDDGREPL